MLREKVIRSGSSLICVSVITVGRMSLWKLLRVEDRGWVLEDVERTKERAS